jgi:hypothetical protein
MSDTVKPADWQNILKLIMLTILSDGRAFEREADSFVDASIDLRTNMNVRGIQTRQMTMDWYIQHRKELIDIQTGETFETVLLELIDSLDGIPNKKPLLRTLKNLSKRDVERTNKTPAISQTSKERWAS